MKIIDSVSYSKENFSMPKIESISQKPTSQPFQVHLRPSSFMLGDRKVGPLRQASHLSVVEGLFLLFPGCTQWLQGLEANLPSSLSDPSPQRHPNGIAQSRSALQLSQIMW
jgi:hypothetical protein